MNFDLKCKLNQNFFDIYNKYITSVNEKINFTIFHIAHFDKLIANFDKRKKCLLMSINFYMR